MWILGSIRFQSGRVWLVSALICMTLLQNLMGAGLVLHQHGTEPAHLHVLGYSDNLEYAAFSPRFGHLGGTDSAIPAISSSVRVIAKISTGSVVAPPQRVGDGEESTLSELFKSPAPDSTQSLETQTANLSAICIPFLQARSTAANLILRNHTLLI